MLLSLSVNTMPLCSLDAGAIHFNLLHPAFGMDTTIQCSSVSQCVPLGARKFGLKLFSACNMSAIVIGQFGI